MYIQDANEVLYTHFLTKCCHTFAVLGFAVHHRAGALSSKVLKIPITKFYSVHGGLI